VVCAANWTTSKLVPRPFTTGVEFFWQTHSNDRLFIQTFWGGVPTRNVVPVTQNVTKIDTLIRPDSLILPLKLTNLWCVHGVWGGVSGWSGGRIGGPIGVQIGSQLTSNWGPYDCTEEQWHLQRDLCNFVYWTPDWNLKKLFAVSGHLSMGA